MLFSSTPFGEYRRIFPVDELREVPFVPMTTSRPSPWRASRTGPYRLPPTFSITSPSPRVPKGKLAVSCTVTADRSCPGVNDTPPPAGKTGKTYWYMFDLPNKSQLLTGKELDLSALIGMLMLIGIVVTNAIVLLDLVQHRIEAGASVRTALIQGGRTRLRPILMTAAATILALIPLALSTGGSLIAASLAIVVIGGLLSSTLLTLVVIPVIYSLLVGLRRGGAGGGDLEASPPAPDQAPRGARTREPVAVGREP